MKTTKKRESFIFYRSFFEAIEEVEAAYQLPLYRAISMYALERREPNLHGFAKVIWKLIRPQLDANWARYDNGCKGADHGVKGGNPNFSKGKPNPYYRDNPKITPPITPNVNENENENENVNGNGNGKDNPIDIF